MDTANNRVCIYTPEITARISYTCAVFFDGKAKLVSSTDEFLIYSGIRINYSLDKIPGSFQIIPHGLLTEKNIFQQDTHCFEWNDNKAFFKTDGDIAFDIFAASFYLLSRYEEYLPHEKDIYGRYAHTNSLAYKEGFLDIPLVNLWMQSLKKLLEDFYPSHQFPIPNPKFRFLPTYDIDIAYAYRYQPLWKNVLAFFRDLVQGKIDKVIERGNVYAGQKQDPFDTFSWLDELHARYKLQPAYFFLTIIKRGKYDKNLSADSKGLQRLYNKLASVYVTGLHPSWQSGTEEDLLLKEKDRLEKIVQHKIFISRNHYLRFTVPHTYRRLVAVDITDDHSMAYGTINGFRASYAMPYRWYDLEKEEITHLVIHPFCFMEANSFFEQGFTAEEAGKEMQYYHDIVKKVNGQFITLFHNHFLTEQPEWVEWRKMYEDFLGRNFG